MKVFPFYKQKDAKDCGPTCLKVIAKHYKKTISIQQLRAISETTREGSSLLGLSEAAEKIGFRSLGVKLTLVKLVEAPLPCILHWNKNHYAVLYKIKKGFFFVSDPAHGLLKHNKQEFLKQWIGNNATDQTDEDIALLLEPTAKFYDSDFDKDKKELVNGAKMRDLKAILHLSDSAIHKRKRIMYQKFNINSNSDRDLVLAARENGFI